MTLWKGGPDVCYAMLRRGRFDYRKKNKITGSRNYEAVAGTNCAAYYKITFTGIARNEFLKLENLWATILSVPRDGMPFAIAFLAFRPTTRPRSRIGQHGNPNYTRRDISLSE